ncbi:type VII secretion integral membrane protein EccD [Streptomyces sp. NPDC051992]|uniref:type VII secretion integral membrane protein EccD n=1 Tax=Streptomyces sp. NPDC051992 TaxID=3161012 RepID=UPI003423BE7E
MTDSSVAGLCRLTIRAPEKTIDLAVPADVPVADLLPTVLRYAGEELEENGLDHSGWVLQRLGGPVLDDEGSLEALDLKDGEVLYLRPHTDALPDVRLDDLVDGIASVVRDRLHGWTADSSRRLLRVLCVLTLLAGLALLAWPGGPVGVRAVGAGAVGALLLAGAASASRAVGDAAAAAVLGSMASPYLALAGWLLPGGDLSGPDMHQVLGARLLAAGAAGAGGAVLGLALAAVSVPFFLATAVFWCAVALGGALAGPAGLTMDGAATVLAALAVMLGGFVPALAFKLAGMRMPSLPTNSQQLQEGIEPYAGGDVTTRTELASGWMTALYGAAGTVCAASLLVLADHPNLPETLTASVLSLLLLLHGRGMVNVPQRLALLLPGVWGAALLVLALAATLAPAERPLLVAGLVACTALLAIVSWTVPGRRLVPYWGRAAELLHSALAISLLPLALWVLGVFAALRAING